jgi:hypothetical protein
LSGEPFVTRVGTREEIFAGPYQALAPDISIMLRGGGVVSILRSPRAFHHRDTPAGTHREEGIFLAAGPGLRRGRSLPDLSITDVAPLVLYRLGVPVPSDMAGRVPIDAFETSHLRRYPVQYSAALSAPPIRETRPMPEQLDGDDEALIVARLRALGYVE